MVLCPRVTEEWKSFPLFGANARRFRAKSEGQSAWGEGQVGSGGKTGERSKRPPYPG